MVTSRANGEVNGVSKPVSQSGVPTDA